MLKIETRADFDKIIEMIKANVEIYENYLIEVQYKLFLANKKIIDISYEKECIPHILGINMNNLRLSGIYREKSAYELMKAFLNSSYRAYNGVSDPSKLFSEYVIDKNEIFRDNLKIVIYDIECIVEYKKDRIYGLDAVECPCEYYILQKRSNKPNIILLQGIVKKGNIYVPQTSQKLDLNNLKSQEIIKNILFHQNITFVNCLRYSNDYESDLKSFYLDCQSKSNQLLTLNRYAYQNEATITLDGDYSFVLKKLNEAYMNENKIKSILQTLSPIIDNGDIIDMDLLGEDIDYDIINVTKAYNNSRFKKTDSLKYSDLLEEYNKLKRLVIQLQQENDTLEQIKIEQSLKIEQLQVENECYKDTEQKIFSLLQNANGGVI